MSAARPGHQGAASRREIAVNLHAVQPATLERCALIRDWLGDHGIARVTLLVVAAADLHAPAGGGSDLGQWLVERRDAGDAIAECGPAGSCDLHRARCASAAGAVVTASGWHGGPRWPAALRRRAARRAPLLRVDLNPEGLRLRHVRGLDELLVDAAGRHAVTAPELATRAAGRCVPRGGTRGLSGASSA